MVNSRDYRVYNQRHPNTVRIQYEYSMVFMTLTCHTKDKGGWAWVSRKRGGLTQAANSRAAPARDLGQSQYNTLTFNLSVRVSGLPFSPVLTSGADDGGLDLTANHDLRRKNDR